MQVRFVGCGDAFGSGGRWQTCVMVSAAGQIMLVDCGATSLTAMRAQGLDPQAVGTVAVTHLHGDHFGGLPFLILDGQFRGRTAPLRIIGPPGTAARLTGTMENLFPGSTAVSRRFDVEVSELAPGASAQAGALRLRCWEVVHASGAPPLALRVEDGQSSFAYSGDTEWTPVLLAAADGANLFAAEAYTFDKPVRYHLSYQTLAANAAQLGAGRTVLTHMGPEMLARQADAEFPMASDGQTFNL
jgi:ribonuclease BN (tRNA processing enzyme)